MENLEKIELEYSINTIPKILFYRLSNPSGLEEWFANKVTLKDGIYTFKWDRSEQSAELVSKKPDECIRYKWIDSEEDTFFEFSLNRQELTGDLELKIIDFVEADEKDNIIEMWNEQVEELKHTLGV